MSFLLLSILIVSYDTGLTTKNGYAMDVLKSGGGTDLCVGWLYTVILMLLCSLW